MVRSLLIIGLFVFTEHFAFAASVTNTSVEQVNVGNVQAKLDASNITNSTIRNSAAGNRFQTGPNANIQGGRFAQQNFGNISSEMNVSNVVNQNVQQNVSGTLVVVN